MRNLLSIFLSIVLSATSYSQAALSDLTIRVENIKSSQGNMKVGLFDNPGHFLNESESVIGVQKDVESSTVTFNIKGIKRGVYAVSIYHDENGNDELDTNIFGIPKEPYAFSNNAKGAFGPPSFQDCQFTIDLDHEEIIITL
ncbi:MAG: DUF2141 domain-containing protein [Bacteroidota bacterium]